MGTSLSAEDVGAVDKKMEAGIPVRDRVDWNSLEAAQYRRQLATDRSPLGWLRRRKTYAEMALRGRCASLLGYVMAVPIAIDKTM
jgi:hypothetical protein